MPPSAMIGTPSCCALRVVCQIADSCGMPAPDTTRVVQIEPAPTPTLTASAPALASASTPSSVTTLPAVTGSDGQLPLIRSIAFTTFAEWPWAVSIDTASTLIATSAATRSSRSAPTPTAAAARSRPWPSREAFGKSRRFWMSLTVISPARQPAPSTSGSFSMRCCWRIARASSSEVPTSAVTSRPTVVGGHELGDRSVEVAALAEPDVAVGEDADEVAVVVGDRHAGELEAVHQRLGLVQQRRRRQA